MWVNIIIIIILQSVILLLLGLISLPNGGHQFDHRGDCQVPRWQEGNLTLNLRRGHIRHQTSNWYRAITVVVLVLHKTPIHPPIKRRQRNSIGDVT